MCLLVKLVLEFCMLLHGDDTARVESYAKIMSAVVTGRERLLSWGRDCSDRLKRSQLTRPIDAWVGSSNHSERCRVKI